ncbi:cytidylyltransferase domain-containing protein, partial [Escherichia coli]
MSFVVIIPARYASTRLPGKPLVDNSARSLGIFREQWLADYYRLKRPALAAWREARAEQQQIIA